VLELCELERRCQKPDHRRIGNWMARRVARPAALRVTRIVAPWGVSATLATLAAWATGVAAAAAFAVGSPWSWIAGAALLQAWYLLDHVDGQLARLRGMASLDGAQLDYLMHHTINMLVPLGVGWGAFARTSQPLWMLAGVACGVSLLLLTLEHDARYRTFFQRLKRLHGSMVVIGGGGGRPEPQPSMPRRPVRLAAWLARKLCETHVVMNMLLAAAVVQLFLRDDGLLVGRTVLAGFAVISPLVATASVARSQRRRATEREFAAWFHAPEGCRLVLRDGWCFVEEPNTPC
jgi:phosphatidylglycerophosphate synthase